MVNIDMSLFDGPRKVKYSPNLFPHCHLEYHPSDLGHGLVEQKLIGIRVPLEEYKQPAFWSFRTKPLKPSTSNDNVGNNSLLIDRSYHTFQAPSSYRSPFSESINEPASYVSPDWHRAQYHGEVGEATGVRWPQHRAHIPSEIVWINSAKCVLDGRKDSKACHKPVSTK